MTSNALPGIYGKLPGRGDFVTLRLPMRFVSAWDGWLQSAVACSREQLGEDWLERYLVSPPWRFLLSHGACGPQPWAGVMIPSVDRVGRYFPLTLAVKLPGPDAGLALLADDSPWFRAAEEALLYALATDFSMETFEAGLQALPDAVPQEGAAALPGPPPGAWGITAARGEKPRPILPPLCARLLEAHYSAYSLWWNESARFDVGLLVSEGLPGVQAYASLLDGNWARGGWSLLSEREAGRPREVADPGVQPVEEAAPPYPPEDGSLAEDLAAPRPTLMDILNEKPRSAAPGLPPVPRQARPEAVAEMPASTAEDGFPSAAATHPGNVREHNEDAVLVRPEVGLWAVADGMGGHRDGATASHSIVAALGDLLPGDGIDDLIEAVQHRLKRIDDQLQALASGSDIVGSTVATLVASGSDGACLWAGDSRVYRLRGGQLAQLTRDHSRTSGVVAQGRPGAGEAARHPQSHVVTRAVGGGDLVLDEVRFSLERGDVFLLCSDGLNRHVADHEIAAVLSQAPSPQAGIDELLTRSLGRGGRDNVSLIAVQVP